MYLYIYLYIYTYVCVHIYIYICRYTVYSRMTCHGRLDVYIHLYLYTCEYTFGVDTNVKIHVYLHT